MVMNSVIITIGVWNKPSVELEGFMVCRYSLTILLENLVNRKWFIFPEDILEKDQGDRSDRSDSKGTDYNLKPRRK